MSPAEPAPECAWALEVILEGHDRPADEESARLHTHLAGCPDCRKVEACEQRLVRVLAGTPVAPTPSDFHRRVKALVRSRRRARRLAASAASVALVAAALLVAFLSLGAGTPPDRLAPGEAPVAALPRAAERFLAAPPPVEALEVLDQQHQAYLAALVEEAGQ